MRSWVLALLLPPFIVFCFSYVKWREDRTWNLMKTWASMPELPQETDADALPNGYRLLLNLPTTRKNANGYGQDKWLEEHRPVLFLMGHQGRRTQGLNLADGLMNCRCVVATHRSPCFSVPG